MKLAQTAEYLTINQSRRDTSRQLDTWMIVKRENKLVYVNSLDFRRKGVFVL